MLKVLLGTILLLVSSNLFGQAKEEVIFFDDFNSPDSYYPELTKNATMKVYTKGLKEGHLLKKWRTNWKYQYFEGSWKQAFYCVPSRDSVMIQAGRSACK